MIRLIAFSECKQYTTEKKKRVFSSPHCRVMLFGSVYSVFLIYALSIIKEEMDTSLEEQKVRFNCPYVIYFRINDQESFCVRNLSLSDYLPLIRK